MDKWQKELQDILDNDPLGLLDAGPSEGLTFSEALRRCKPLQKITFGTATNLFHVIGPSYMDFNTSFAFTKEDAERVGSRGVIACDRRVV